MRIGPYTITSPLPLTPAEASILTEALPLTTMQSTATLGGRGSLQFIDGIAGKHVAIKPYLRGGLMGKVNRKYYFGRGKSRAARECELLDRLTGTEVSTPTPLGFIESGRVLRRCWLLMETVPHDHTLASAPLTESQKEALFARLAPQMKALLDLGIHHVDLHPGNIIVTHKGLPVLIDFDKARIGIEDKKALSELYVKRWARAVIKHRLPESLSKQFARMMAKL
ncbi:lipopolysaccharide kinase InaA family protein [Desulfoluna spongiiphila]|uniref:lipopolysaccharide kinase InaA family protein n=1 Tax=Desulfoluna spongiiphila TaxID=419481 RepID=UPI00125B9166|nr:lipopolysaccharide kinase InaA family protein [Desulfoluna spongiiphila]VVS90558.1 protein kinase domain [Desulfoluna spongiiphila]